MSQLFQDFGKEVKGRKVFIATTCYENPAAAYTFSIGKSLKALENAGITYEYHLLTGNCHVDDARNVMVKEFLLGKCTEMIFIDADVSWNPEDLIRLIDADRDLVGAVYPFRRPGENENMPVRMKKGVYKPDADGLMEVEGLPTGFMKISRKVLTTLAKSASKYWQKDDRRRKVPLLFERTLLKGGQRMGGDINFCRKWRQAGGKVYSLPEMRLGHTGTVIVRKSLGASLRVQTGQTLIEVVKKVQKRKETISDLVELREYIGNPYGALEDILAVCVAMARKAKGPIIETGSGITTILMAVANQDQTVYCLEHDPVYAEKLRQMAREVGLKNIGLCVCPIKNGWYDLKGMNLPYSFALGLNDGPPRTDGSRMGFFDAFGSKVDNVIADDADDPSYREALEKWAKKEGKTFDFIEPRAALIRSK